MPIKEYMTAARSATTTTKRVGGRSLESAAALASVAGYSRQGYGDGMNAAELYNHNQGYSYAIIRTIANRIARQPVRVARFDKPKKSKSGPRGLKRATRTQIASAPREIKSDLEQGSVQLYETHPILDALRRPNPIMVAHTMMFVTVCALEIVGRAFWWLRPSDDGERKEIWPIPPHWVEPIHTDDELFAGWSVMPGGVGPPIVVPPGEMVYFYYPDPADPLSSLSPMRAGQRTIMSDEAVEESQRKTFVNSLAPKLAVTVGQMAEASGVTPAAQPVLTREQRRALRTLLKQEYRGVSNEGEMLILDGFIRDIKPIYPAPKEMDYLQSGQTTQERLAKIWGMNPISMGQTGANRAESAVADDHFCSNVVNPRIILLSQTMSRGLVDYFGGDESDIVYMEPAVAEDVEFELTKNTELLDRGVINRNEVRSAYGKPPLEDGDNAFIRQGGGGRGDQGGAADGGDEGDEDGDGEDRGGAAAPHGAVPVVVDESSAPKKSARVKRHRPNPSAAEVLGRKEVVKFWLKREAGFERQARDSVSAVAARLGESAARQMAGSLPGSADPSATAAAAFDADSWERELTSAAAPLFRAAAEWAAVAEWQLNAKPMGRRQTADGPHPRTLAYSAGAWAAKLSSRTYWAGVMSAARKRAAAAVLSALTAGSNPESAARTAVEVASAVVASAAANRVQAAVESGRDAAYQHLVRRGIVTGREWVAVKDGKTRHDHRHADGQVVTGHDLFTVGGERARFPGDPNLTAKQRVNCRCKTFLVRR